MDKEIKFFMDKIRRIEYFDRVKFVILFGSRAERRANKFSDYDFAVYFEGDNKEKFNFLLKANFDKKYDVKIFQDLPLFIRKDVLRGKILYVSDIDFLYNIAYLTIKDFDRFKKYYYDYIYYEVAK